MLPWTQWKSATSGPGWRLRKDSEPGVCANAAHLVHAVSGDVLKAAADLMSDQGHTTDGVQEHFPAQALLPRSPAWCSPEFGPSSLHHLEDLCGPLCLQPKSAKTKARLHLAPLFQALLLSCEVTFFWCCCLSLCSKGSFLGELNL